MIAWTRLLTIAIAGAVLFVFPALGAVAALAYLAREVRDLTIAARISEERSKEA